MTTTNPHRSIRYTSTLSALGPLLLAASERGVCHVQFADDPPALEKGLAEEFPFAVLERDDYL